MPIVIFRAVARSTLFILQIAGDRFRVSGFRFQDLDPHQPVLTPFMKSDGNGGAYRLNFEHQKTKFDDPVKSPIL